METEPIIKLMAIFTQEFSKIIKHMGRAYTNILMVINILEIFKTGRGMDRGSICIRIVQVFLKVFENIIKKYQVLWNMKGRKVLLNMKAILQIILYRIM